jgi:F-type H+-transporting ATPase subunit b
VKKNAISILLVSLVLVLSPFALAAAEGGEHGDETPSTYFGIPAGVLKFVNLVVFLSLLIWVLKGPISKAFKDRGEKIRADLDEARRRQEKADSLAADIQARLDSIEKEVASIIERANVDGEKQKQEIIEGARAEAEKILTSARAEVDARVKLARQELITFAGELAATRAHQLLTDSMDDADRRKVFSESVDNLAETRS